MQFVYSPGCALLLYKPHLAKKVLDFLSASPYPGIREFLTCCHHEPGLPPGTVVINTCPGCDRRFGSLYDGVSTLSLWEVLAQCEDFPFPDYGGAEVSVHDACPVRQRPPVHAAVRRLLERMNLRVRETEKHGTSSVCCGDSFYPVLPVEEVRAQMRARADSMPCDEVAVYCVSCVKSTAIGGKKPRYLVDLLFGEETIPGDTDTVRWHEQVDAFIESH